MEGAARSERRIGASRRRRPQGDKSSGIGTNALTREGIIRRGASGRQRAGGLAALYLAVAYLIAMPYFLLVVDYPSVTDPLKKVALLADHRGSLYAMHLITYVVFGLVLAVLALALHDRLKDRMPATMRVATAVGLVWAVILVASGLVFNSGMGTVAELYHSHPAQAVAAWQAIEPVTEGLSGVDGEILGGLWVLLVSWVALRTGGLSKMLTWLGLGVGAVGILSVVPALKDAAIVFGLLQIVWLVGLGIALLRTGKGRAEQAAPDAATIGGVA
jgi:hypothetical protein